jgi:hypothetical protein
MIARRQQSGAETGDPQRVSEEIVSAIADGKTVCHLVETGDGRIVRVVNQPMGAADGWRPSTTSPTSGGQNANATAIRHS